jgi:hypothetical protein
MTDSVWFHPGELSMSKDDEYRDYAARTMDLAQRASSSADKGRLLMMAEAWLDLADRVHCGVSHEVQKARELHPVIRTPLIENHEFE